LPASGVAYQRDRFVPRLQGEEISPKNLPEQGLEGTFDVVESASAPRPPVRGTRAADHPAFRPRWRRHRGPSTRRRETGSFDGRSRANSRPTANPCPEKTTTDPEPTSPDPPGGEPRREWLLGPGRGAIGEGRRPASARSAASTAARSRIGVRGPAAGPHSPRRRPTVGLSSSAAYLRRGARPGRRRRWADRHEAGEGPRARGFHGGGGVIAGDRVGARPARRWL